MNNEQLLKLVREVMKMLLAGNSAELEILRSQYDQSSIKSVELTGAGFYIDFDIPGSVQRLDKRCHMYIGDLGGEVEGLEAGLGFILWIDDGAISSLEGYTYEEEFPEILTGYRLAYFGGERDLESISQTLSC